MVIFYLLMVGVGYFLYPHIIPQATGPAPTYLERSVTLASGDVVKVSLRGLTRDDFPEQVSITVPSTLTGNGKSIELAEGAQVTPLGLEGQEVIVRHQTLPIEGRLPLENTNFQELTLNKMVANLESHGKPKGPSPEELEAAAEAERLAKEEAEKKAAEEKARMAADEEARIAAEEAAKVPVVLSAEEIEAFMKSELETKPLTEFSADKIATYKAGETETIDGVEYQTGTASYMKKTMFGDRTLSAKALIKNGVLVKWVSPKTGLQLQ